MNINLKSKKTLTMLIWGFALIFAAVFIILDSAGVNFGITLSPWRIILGALLLAWIVALCVKLRFTDLFFPLAFLFLVFEGPIAAAVGREDGDLINNWIVLLAALMLTIGFKAVFSRHGAVQIGGKSGGSGDGCGASTGEVKGKLGSTVIYLSGKTLGEQHIHDNMGKVEVFFTDKNDYAGDGIIRIHDNLGAITLHLPTEWDVVTQMNDNLGKVNIPQKDSSGGKQITLCIHDNLGSIGAVYEGEE